MIRKYKKNHKKIPTNINDNLAKTSPILLDYLPNKKPINSIHYFIYNHRKTFTVEQNKPDRNHKVLISIQLKLNIDSHHNRHKNLPVTMHTLLSISYHDNILTKKP